MLLRIEEHLAALRLSSEQRAHILEAVFVALAEKAIEPAARPLVSLTEMARSIHSVRLRANDLIGEPLLRDPKWDMLLDLFVAYEEGRRTSVTDLCVGSGVSQTAALRHLRELELKDFVVRRGDPTHARRIWVDPTPKAIAAVDACFPSSGW